MTQRKSQEMRQISSQAPQFPLMKRSREEAVAMLRQKTSLWGQFQELPEALREELLSFAMGNSGLKVCYDPIFKMVFDPEEAWLLFLSSNQTEDIMRIIEKYPYFRELYEETAKFQIKPEELVGMYSEVLEMMDRNTVQYMIDEQQQVIERQKKLMAEKELQIQEKDSQLREKDSQLQEKEAENNRLKNEGMILNFIRDCFYRKWTCRFTRRNRRFRKKI